MFIASTLGFASGPLIAPEWWPNYPQRQIGLTFHFISSMHIGLTYFFYIDRDAKELIASQRYRFYVVAPSLLLIFFSAFYFATETLRNLIWIGLGIWTLWHFQKQNYGIFCLIGTARGDARPRRSEINAIYLGGVAGTCLNAIGYAGGLAQLGWSELVHPVFTAGCVLQGVAIGFALWTIYEDRQALSVRHVFLMLFASYWLTLAIMPWSVAWLTSAAGHGYQYIAIMAMVGAGSGENFRPSRVSHRLAPLLGLAVTAAIGLGVYIAADRIIYHVVPAGAQSDALANGIIGLSFSFTAVHYLLDAGIWRLSKPVPRQYVRQKLAFIFS